MTAMDTMSYITIQADVIITKYPIQSFKQTTLSGIFELY